MFDKPYTNKVIINFVKKFDVGLNGETLSSPYFRSMGREEHVGTCELSFLITKVNGHIPPKNIIICHNSKVQPL